MFKKVLIAEDFQGDNKSIVDTLKEKLGIPYLYEELYCDKAYNRISVALQENDPFELLVTDLSFKESHLEQKLNSGEELIAAVRKIQPDIKIIVNSMEDNPSKVQALFNQLNIDGYVCKGRQSLNELVMAVQHANENKAYTSPQINLNANSNVFQLEELDLIVLKSLADGYSKREIREQLIKQNIKPNSESAIDKRVSKLFVEFGVKNSTELVAKLIRNGII